MPGPLTDHGERLVSGAGTIGLGVPAPVLEHSVDQPQLRAALVTAGQGLLRPRLGQAVQQRAAPLVVHGPAVVRVDQGEIPHLGALVQVGNPGAGQQQRRLRQRVDPSSLDEPVLGQEALQISGEALVGENGGDKGGQGVVVAGVRVDPGGVYLGFLGRLLHERGGPARLDRPGAHQGLIQQVLGVAVRPAVALVPLVVLRPARHRALPFLGQLRQHADAGPHVTASLGVMGREGEHRLRPSPRRRAHGPVELLGRAAEAARVTAHLIERDQGLIPVESRVFLPLGHDRRAHLGEPHDEVGLGRAGIASGEQFADEAEQLGVEVGPALPRGVYGGGHVRPVRG